MILFISTKKNCRKFEILKKVILLDIISFSFFITFIIPIKRNKMNQESINKYRLEEINKRNEININSDINFPDRKCYSLVENIRIIHLIITRFLINSFSKEFPRKFRNRSYNDSYIQNGIRVMKTYLLPSLENQSCKNFTWIILIGAQANITQVNALLNFNNSFEKEIIYQEDLKNYIRNKSKNFDILISTRIDYDDRIYYDAVNDVRKAININRPMVLHGYNRGLVFYENLNEYYYFDFTPWRRRGVMSIFVSLIIVLDKVNDVYTIYDLGVHDKVRKVLLKRHKLFGIKELNYEPAIFDSGVPKFVWVRQIFSGWEKSNRKKDKDKRLKINNFNLSLFYGK